MPFSLPFRPLTLAFAALSLAACAPQLTPPQDVPLVVKDGYASNGNVKIHYVSVGQGPLLVLIHGHPDYWYGWRN